MRCLSVSTQFSHHGCIGKCGSIWRCGSKSPADVILVIIVIKDHLGWCSLKLNENTIQCIQPRTVFSFLRHPVFPWASDVDDFLTSNVVCKRGGWNVQKHHNFGLRLESTASALQYINMYNKEHVAHQSSQHATETRQDSMHNSRLRAQFSTVVVICHGKWSVPRRNFTPVRKWLPLAWEPQNCGQTCILFGINLSISQEKRTNTFQTSVMKVHKQGATFEVFVFFTKKKGPRVPF